MKNEKTRLAVGQTICPSCGSDWDGGSILESFIQRREEGDAYWQQKSDEQIKEEVRLYYPPPYRWQRKIGVAIQGGYDGVSYWQCPDCKKMWNRATGEEADMVKY